MSNKINLPYQYFVDPEGNPVNGFLYIGTNGNDPELNTQQAYSDQTLSTTLSQPIEIRNGLPISGGNQVEIYTASRHSLRVVACDDTILYTKLSSDNLFCTVRLCGTDAFSTAGTKAVTFSTAEVDTSYKIIITGNANETFYATSKLTTGFTLNSSNASSTASVDWIVVR